MPELITTAAEVRDYPLGSTFTDTQADVWVFGQQLGGEWLYGPETGLFPAEHVLKKWGPLTLQWRPDVPAEPQRVQPSREEVVDAISRALYGSHIANAIDVATDAILALLAAQPTVEEVVEQYRKADGYTPALRDVALERMTHTERGWTAESSSTASLVVSSMAERFTTVRLGTAGFAMQGRHSAAEMIAELRMRARKQLAEAQMVLASPDEAFEVFTGLGVNIVRNREVIQKPTAQPVKPESPYFSAEEGLS